MADQRRANANWNVHQADGTPWSTETTLYMILATMMDIRDEIQQVRRDVGQFNASIQCRNFQRVPAKLDRIARAADKLAKKVSGDPS